MDMLDHLASLLLTRLAWTSLQAAVLVAAVALIVRRWPQLPASLRSLLWWLVSLQVALGLCWHAPIALPLLAVPAAPAYVEAPAAVDATASVTLLANHGPAVSTAIPSPPSTGILQHWYVLLAAAWLLGLLLQLPVLLRQGWHAASVRRRSAPLQDASLRALCARQAQMLGLRRLPALRESAEITSPQVSGLLRPTMLWPAGHTLTSVEASMALMHELAHLRRGDLWLGWLPAVAQRLYFFHPLVAIAVREYAFHREAACDAQVLQQGDATTQAYGRLLLRLGVSRALPSGFAGASASFQHLKRRLGMLQHLGENPRGLSRAWLPMALMALVSVMPYRLTARTTPSAATTTGAAQAIAATSVGGAGRAQPPTGRRTERSTSSDIDVYTSSTPSKSAYALYHQDNGHTVVTIRGTRADVAEAKRLHGQHPEMFWFRRGEAAYLILDTAYIDRIRAAYWPTTLYQRQQGPILGEHASLQGQLRGLQAWKDSVTRQRRELLRGDPRAPGFDQRMASLDAQQTDIDGRTRDLQARRAALPPEPQRMREWQQIQDQADQQAARVIDEALANGAAQRVSAR